MHQGAKRRLTQTLHNSSTPYNTTYLMTVARHNVKAFITKQDIQQVIKLLEDSIEGFKIIQQAYEISPVYKQLHGHFIVVTSKTVCFRRNCSLLGFRIQWSPIYDLPKAIRYVTKDTDNCEYLQEQILIINYYNHHYSFIDENENPLGSEKSLLSDLWSLQQMMVVN